MTEREYQALQETSWRRPLTAEEEARLQVWLGQHPEAQAEWETTASLHQLLSQLPDAPLSSNFTARVLQTVDQETAPTPVRSAFYESLLRFVRSRISRLAWAAVFLVVAFFAYQQYQDRTQDKLAQDLVQFTAAEGLGEPTVLLDFDAIQRVGQQSPPADEELWMVLNQTQSQ